MQVGIEMTTDKEGVFELAYYDFEPLLKFFSGCLEHGEKIVMYVDRENTEIRLAAVCGRLLTIIKGN